MSIKNNQYFRQIRVGRFLNNLAFTLFGLLAFLAVAGLNVRAQGPNDGSFVGTVADSVDQTPLVGARVEFINQNNNVINATKSDSSGRFQRGSLPPAVYLIRVIYAGYQTRELTQVIVATKSNDVKEVPIKLVKIPVAVAVNNPDSPPDPNPSPASSPVSTAAVSDTPDNQVGSDTTESISLNPRRDEAFNDFRVRALPLGGTTLTRTFDELALLVPGVAAPPQAIGNSVGPGIGGGVGTSGQFAVNGLRSRANNFTVDGSDNNDEDIGVRRQGFFTLVPQPVESIQEFQIITLLAPAEFGRNLGAQVNAISKSGGNAFHGTLFGFLTSDRLNARNFFDYDGGDTTTGLTALNNSGRNTVPVFVNGTQQRVSNDAGEKDSSTLVQGGFAVGGRIVRDKMFFFVSGEGQNLNAVQERHFAVPTVEQRGLFGLGAEGFTDCFNSATGLPGSTLSGRCRTTSSNGVQVDTAFTAGYPTSVSGDAVFSLFPFANDPTGIYGRNTYSQALSADARGRIFSGKYDYNFPLFNQPQKFTARYNYTDDRRDLTDVGGALFSSIRPKVRTDNFSSFLSGGLTDKISNELRFSFGRSRLEFEELHDTTGFILPVSGSLVGNAEDRRFLLNARITENDTLRTGCDSFGCASPTRATYSLQGTTETSVLGPIGQLIISGFSPVGVDVFNFPQERTNDTIQLADTVRRQIANHSLSFGTDLRRTTLNSDLPRNSRPLVTFNGGLDSRTSNLNFLSPTDFAAAGAATGFFQSLVLPGKDSRIELGYYQLNFFGQDEYRVRRNLSINYGVRYEYNTTPKEADGKIEDTFGQTLPSFLSGLGSFIDGRDSIYESDENNFAARVGFAYEPLSSTVVRGGFGMYYDQIIGAVVGQSRNVFPTFTTVNFGGGVLVDNNARFNLFNPQNAVVSRGSNLVFNCTDFDDGRCNSPDYIHFIQPGTLNTINPALTSQQLRAALIDINSLFPTPFGATLPTKKLDTPLSYQYSIGVERKLFGNMFLSIAYVGTTGRNLLRFTTPNLGSNYVASIRRISFLTEGRETCSSINLYLCVPQFTGDNNDTSISAIPKRPVKNVGAVNQFETTGRSRYDSLQINLRGRFLTDKLQYQVNYVYGSVKDDVSDVFDLAGSSALPQNSLSFAGEYAPANFDVRHRVTYNFVYDLPGLRSQNDYVEAIFGGWQISGTGKYNTGQPFTVNSIFDVNLDGNLTDRLNNTQFITETDDRQQPLALTSNANLRAMLAGIGQDGTVSRNSFRAGSVLDMDLSFVKRFRFTESQNLQLRLDVFNFINRANFGIPVRFLESPSFGQATETVTPGRRFQFALKYSF